MEAQLKNDIKNKTFKNVYVFTGDEKYLADYYSKEICNALVDEDMKEFNFLKLSTLPSPEDIDAFASSYPFMSEHKVMLVKDTGIMKNAPEDVKEYFTELLSSVPDYLVVIFNEANIDKRNTVYKAASKVSAPLEFAYKKLTDAPVSTISASVYGICILLQDGTIMAWGNDGITAFDCDSNSDTNANILSGTPIIIKQPNS